MNHLLSLAFSPNSLFLSAIMHHEKPLLEYLITHVNINAADNQGRTFLMHAVAEGNPGVVELLLNHGADVNQRCNDGSTALMFAISLERIDVIRLLIAYGADVNIGNNFELFPIQLAVHIKNTNIVKILLAAGAKLNQSTSLQPPLHRAVLQGNRELVYLFLQNGVKNKNPNTETSFPANMFLLNNAGVSAFGIAICNGDVKLVELFLKFNPDLRYAVDCMGNSALHAAAYFNQREIFTMLVQAGADVHSLNDNGLTSIQCLLSGAIFIDSNCTNQGEEQCNAV